MVLLNFVYVMMFFALNYLFVFRSVRPFKSCVQIPKFYQWISVRQHLKNA